MLLVFSSTSSIISSIYRAKLVLDVRPSKYAPLLANFIYLPRAISYRDDFRSTIPTK